MKLLLLLSCAYPQLRALVLSWLAPLRLLASASVLTATFAQIVNLQQDQPRRLASTTLLEGQTRGFPCYIMCMLLICIYTQEEKHTYTYTRKHKGLWTYEHMCMCSI